MENALYKCNSLSLLSLKEQKQVINWNKQNSFFQFVLTRALWDTIFIHSFCISAERNNAGTMKYVIYNLFTRLYFRCKYSAAPTDTEIICLHLANEKARI